MIITTAIVTFVSVLLENTLLYFIGQILSKPLHLRVFLGLPVEDENQNSIKIIANSVRLIGEILQLTAIVNILIGVGTAAAIWYNIELPK